MFEPELPEPIATLLSDPRDESGFQARLFPRCDGENWLDARPDSASRRSRLRFLFAYYRINATRRELSRIAGCDEEHQRRARDMRRWSRLRDALEDLHAPYGFIGEPKFAGEFVEDVIFTAPPERFIETKKGRMRSISLRIPIPIPGIPAGQEGEETGAESSGPVPPDPHE